MSTDRKQKLVVLWHGMYLTSVEKLTHGARFSWAPVNAMKFETREQAEAAIASIARAPQGVAQFEHGYEIIDDPVR
jgi:hypothetical protein